MTFMGDDNLMSEKEYAYSDYWEKCWNNENVSELTRYLSSWNGTKSDEMDIFINLWEYLSCAEFNGGRGAYFQKEKLQNRWT